MRGAKLKPRNIDLRYLNMPAIRALDVLTFISEPHGPFRLKDVAVGLNLSKATAFRYLKTLEVAGAATYSVETGFYTVAADWLGGLLDGLAIERLREVGRPFATELADGLHCVVNLGVLEGRNVRYADICLPSDGADDHQLMRARIGGTDPVHTTALGKAMLAFMPIDEVKLALPAVMRRRTAASIADRGRLVSELSAVRRRGYARDTCENEEGAHCVGAPIFTLGDRLAGGISLSAFSPQSSAWSAKAGREVRQAANKISEHLRASARIV